MLIVVALFLVAALTFADGVLAPIRTARTLALAQSCEATLLRVLREGFVSSERDLLRVARELDASRAAGAIDADQRPLLGVPVCCLSIDGGVTGSALESHGALVLTQFSADEALDLRNPRDAGFLLSTDGFSDVDRAVAAVAAGKIACAVIQPSSSIIPLSVSWSGLTALSLPASDQARSRGSVLCGCCVDDVVTLRDCLRPGYEKSDTVKSLKGLRLAYCSSESAIYEGPVDPYVAAAVEVAVEVLRGMGAECLRVSSLDEKLSLPEGCVALLTPHAPSAAAVVGDRSFELPRERRATTDRLTSRTVISLPAGVVAGEDDGYDSSLNELHHMEGLPVGFLIVSSSSSAESAADAALIARSFEMATRWSSELLNAGRSREEAKADLDDARELFGIFFPTTLLKYVGKRR